MWKHRMFAENYMLVDAHHHLWDLRVRDQDWIAGAELAPLRRNFLLSDYELVAAADGVTASVVVQTVCVPEETPELLELAGAGDRSPFTLLHGLADDIVPPSVSRSFASSLQHNGWPAEFVTLDADHGSIAGAFYDAAADKYFAAKDSVSLGVAEDVAGRIAAVTVR